MDAESPPSPRSPATPPPSSETEMESPAPTPAPPSAVEDIKSSWQSFSADDLKRTVVSSTDSALRSARSFQENSTNHFRTLQDLLPHIGPKYRSYEEAFFRKFKDELAGAREHPAVAGGIAIAAGLLLMRGPRRFLFRQTFGRLQSEEAQFLRAEKNVKELNLSVDIMKKESQKLLQRTALAENEMKRGHTQLMAAGSDIQKFAKYAYKMETQAADLMDGLREIPGREALKLRAEVASMSSAVKQQKNDLNKRIMKISELGVPV